jgi:transcriptional regulator with XRE-family HTH domain
MYSPEELTLKIGRDIRNLRVLKNINRHTLCSTAQVSMSALRKLETNGKASIQTLVKVLQALDKTDWLLNLSPQISINPLDMTRRGKSRKRGAKTRKLYQPAWLTPYQEIEYFYSTARTRTAMSGIPHVVDHIVPITGKNVSGLHVPWNLRIITREENSRKNNKVSNGR